MTWRGKNHQRKGRLVSFTIYVNLKKKRKRLLVKVNILHVSFLFGVSLVSSLVLLFFSDVDMPKQKHLQVVKERTMRETGICTWNIRFVF